MIFFLHFTMTHMNMCILQICFAYKYVNRKNKSIYTYVNVHMNMCILNGEIHTRKSRICERDAISTFATRTCVWQMPHARACGKCRNGVSFADPRFSCMYFFVHMNMCILNGDPHTDSESHIQTKNMCILNGDFAIQERLS